MRAEPICADDCSKLIMVSAVRSAVQWALEVSADLKARRVEVWECGLAHPGALVAAGLPGRSGLTLGMGRGGG